jgi:putative transcriptional regulator
VRLESSLRARGFKVVSNPSGDYSFDVLAGKPGDVLAIKVLEDMHHEKARKYVDDLRSLALSLDVVPLVACVEGIPEGSLVTYKGVPSLNLETVEKLLNGEESPFIYFSKGGVYVKIRGDVVKRLRREKGLSLGDLSFRLGVTRRMVYEYEVGRSDATLEVAYKLVQLLGEEVVEKLNFKNIARYFMEQSGESGREVQASRAVKDPLLKWLLIRLEEMGFFSRVLEKAPFNVAAKGQVRGKCKVVIKKSGSSEEEALTVNAAKICGSYALFINGEGLRLIGEREVRAPSKPENLDLKEIFESAGLQ